MGEPLNFVVVDGERHALEPVALVIHEDTIDQNLRQEPVFFDRYTRLMARARVHYETCVSDLKIVEAEVRMAVQEANAQAVAKKTGDKKTVDAINSEVITSKPYRAAVAKLNDANLQYRLLEEFVHSLQHKKDDLLELARNWRERFKAKESV